MAGERLTLAFGKVLRKLRVKHGLSQEALAHQAKTGQPYVSLLEAGRHSPSLATAHLIATAFKMKLSELVRVVEKEADRPTDR